MTWNFLCSALPRLAVLAFLTILPACSKQSDSVVAIALHPTKSTIVYLDACAPGAGTTRTVRADQLTKLARDTNAHDPVSETRRDGLEPQRPDHGRATGSIEPARRGPGKTARIVPQEPSNPCALFEPGRPGAADSRDPRVDAAGAAYPGPGADRD